MSAKKEKCKISKLMEKSDSENVSNEHELSFYMNDRVKLMKEVLKIIKPKKIKSMAPDCIKDLDIEEINSMLLEELLGISNKRLKYIFNGQNLNEDSSSTDPEEEKPIDIISLDDVSDDDFVIDVDAADKSNIKKTKRVKTEPKIKKEKHRKLNKKPLEEESLMSVLELLELQARARAIRSQLMLEASKKIQNPEPEVKVDHNSDDTDDAVIIESPKNDEIIITSSDSELEQTKTNSNKQNTENEQQTKKIKLVRDRFSNVEANQEKHPTVETITVSSESKENKVTNERTEEKCENNQERDDDEIILIVDQEEMDGIIGES